MKTIIFLLVSFWSLLVFPLFAQYSPSGVHSLALEMLKEMPVLGNVETRGESFLLDSTVSEIFAENGWEPSEKVFFLYNPEFLLVKDSTIIWVQDPPTGPTWRPAMQQTHTYTVANDLETTTQTVWDLGTNDWSLDSFRITNLYDNGRLAAVWSEQYDPSLGNWEKVAVDSLIYDETGQLTGRAAYFPSGNALVPAARIFYGYEDGLLASDLFQFTFDGGDNWINFFRQFYDYENGLLATRQLDFYDEQTSNFSEAELETFTYDEEDRLVHTDVFAWAGEWLQYQRTDLFYSEKQSTGVDDMPVIGQVEILMANPFPGGLAQAPGLDTDGIYDVAIYNMAGQPVFRQKLAGNAWQLPALQGTGIHVILVADDSGVLATRKLAVAR